MIFGLTILLRSSHQTTLNSIDKKNLTVKSISLSYFSSVMKRVGATFSQRHFAELHISWDLWHSCSNSMIREFRPKKLQRSPKLNAPCNIQIIIRTMGNWIGWMLYGIFNFGGWLYILYETKKIGWRLFSLGLETFSVDEKVSWFLHLMSVYWALQHWIDIGCILPRRFFIILILAIINVTHRLLDTNLLWGIGLEHDLRVRIGAQHENSTMKFNSRILPRCICFVTKSGLVQISTKGQYGGWT